MYENHKVIIYNVSCLRDRSCKLYHNHEADAPHVFFLKYERVSNYVVSLESIVEFTFKHIYFHSLSDFN